MIKYCETCAAYNQNQCALSNLKVNPKTDYCSKYISNPHICAICGRPSAQIIFEINSNDEILRKICPICYSTFGTCASCLNSRDCAFETDPINIPPVIEKQINNNGMIMITTVKNPERKAATCKKKCACWDPIDKVCNRSCQTCGNYKSI